MRFGIIVFVAFMVADILSDDTGSKVIFADQVKAREYILLGEHDRAVAHWDNKETDGLKYMQRTAVMLYLRRKHLLFIMIGSIQ